MIPNASLAKRFYRAFFIECLQGKHAVFWAAPFSFEYACLTQRIGMNLKRQSKVLVFLVQAGLFSFRS